MTHNSVKEKNLNMSSNFEKKNLFIYIIHQKFDSSILLFFNSNFAKLILHMTCFNLITSLFFLLKKSNSK